MSAAAGFQPGDRIVMREPLYIQALSGWTCIATKGQRGVVLRPVFSVDDIYMVRFADGEERPLRGDYMAQAPALEQLAAVAL